MPNNQLYVQIPFDHNDVLIKKIKIKNLNVRNYNFTMLNVLKYYRYNLIKNI